MASVRARINNGILFFDFRYLGLRCREYTVLQDSPSNRRKMEQVLKKIEAEITLGIFDYRKYFPNSPMVEKFHNLKVTDNLDVSIPRFEEFSKQWFAEREIEWQQSYKQTIGYTKSK